MAESSLERIRAMLDAVSNLVFLLNVSGEIEEVGEQGAARLGFTPSEIRSRSGRDLVHPDDHVRLSEAPAPMLPGHEERFEVRLMDAQGKPHLYLLSQRRFDDTRIIVSGTESASVTDSDSRFSDLMTLADLSDDVFMVTDRDGVIQYINAAATTLLGEQEFIGRNIDAFVDQQSWATLSEQIRAGEQRLDARILGIRADGTVIPLELRSRFDEDTQQWFTVHRNISALVANEGRMRRLNVKLRHQATTDPLTGVANRIAFAEAVEQAIATNKPFSVLLLDMDDFKSVNDTLGHGVGDDFLRLLARRLQRAVALQDLVARIGGDEFVVYVPQLDESDAAALAARLLEVISAPFRVGAHKLSRSCSIGGATWVEGDSFTDVLRKADQAAYKAKHAGRSRFAMHGGSSNGHPADSAGFGQIVVRTEPSVSQ